MKKKDLPHMTDKSTIPQNRISIREYKLDTYEDFDKAVGGLKHSMQLTIDVLSLNGHYERMLDMHPTKSIVDALFMNLVLGEIRLVQNNRFKKVEVKKKRVYKKRNKQLTMNEILGE